MGGFNTVIGFMFSFFLIAGFMLYSFSSFTDEINKQNSLLNDAKKMVVEKGVSYSISNSYYDGDRLKVVLTNTGSSKLFFKQRNNYCLDVYINSNFISSENYNIYMFDTTKEYYFLDINEIGILDIDIDINSSNDINLDVIACSDSKSSKIFENSSFNWLDESYNYRSKIIVTNVNNTNYKDRYFEVILNSSNFDFTKATQNDIKFLLPISENLVIDSNFDFYNQSLNELSKYSNIATLGLSSTIATDDPLSEKNSVFFNGLNFDGVNDFVNIVSDQSLELERAITFSSWIKWSGVGNSNHTIFRNGKDNNRISIINNGTPNDGKILFSLDVNGVKKELYSNSIIDTNWHLITTTFNESMMRIYIDKTLDNSLSFTNGNITFTLANNQIGSSNSKLFFNGSIDDVKVFNMVLNSSDIDLLYSDNLRYKTLNYTINSWSVVGNNASINVKLPFIANLENISLWVYY